jgi:hypothetical protein
MNQGRQIGSRPRGRPRLAVLYLLVVTVAAFAIPAWSVTAGLRWYLVPSLLGLQVVLLVAARIPVRDILSIATRLRWLFLFLLASYLLLPPDPSSGDQLVSWQPIAGWRSVTLNLSGVAAAAMMCLQIVTVILVSAGVRLTGTGTDLVDGLRAFGLPTLFVYSIDHTLALLGGMRRRGAGGGAGGGGGGGRGGGGGHRGGRADTAEVSSLAAEGGSFGAIRAFLRGDVGAFTRAINQSLARAREHVARESGGRLESTVVHDVAAITGISLMMMSLKMLKILPGIPFFSGFKTLLLYPLYILASELTHSRWGGTVCGTIMGVIGFLQGDGRYGVMEILKHAVPGLVVDLTWPVVRRLPRAALVYCALGFVLAIARTSTEFLTVLLLRPRDEVFLFPVVKLVPNLVAGTLSGLVTFFVLPAFRHADRLQATAHRDAVAAKSVIENDAGRV